MRGATRLGAQWLQDPRDDRVGQPGRELALRVARAPRADFVLLQRRRQRRAAERASGARNPPAEPRLHLPPHPRERLVLHVRLDAAAVQQTLHRAQPGDLFVVRVQRRERGLEGRESAREVARVEVGLDEALPGAAVCGVDVGGLRGLRSGAVPVAAADVDEGGVGVGERVRLDFVRLVEELECGVGVSRLVCFVACTMPQRCLDRTTWPYLRDTVADAGTYVRCRTTV